MTKLNKVEHLFERTSNFDNKNILNKSNYIINHETINLIENNNITLELLDDLLKNTKVFKYKTQITIHGQFPDIRVIQFYKNIFQNKNKSIGVRYNAIDIKKKKHISKIVYKLDKYKVYSSASEFYLYKSSLLADRSELTDKYNEYKLISDKIDTDLFNGGIEIEAGYIHYYGYMIQLKVIINSIPENNVNKLISNLTDLDYNVAMNKYNEIIDNDNKKRQEQETEWVKENELRKQKEQLLINSLNLDNKYTKIIPTKNGIYFNVQAHNETIKYTFYRVENQKVKVLVNNVLEIPKNLNRQKSRTINPKTNKKLYFYSDLNK